jgi:hypothetical protein
MFDEDFLPKVTEVERAAWIAFRSVVTKFLGKTRTLTTLLLLQIC